MSQNEIIAEIHRHREVFARECGFDVHEMFRRIRSNAGQLEAESWKFVSPTEVVSEQTHNEPHSN